MIKQIEHSRNILKSQIDSTFLLHLNSPRDWEAQPTLTPRGEKQLYHPHFPDLHLFPDQEEAARCGRLPGGSQSGLHPAGHRLQRGEPHVDEGQRSGGEQAQQRHPAASSDLQRGRLLWRKEPQTRSETPRGKPKAACSDDCSCLFMQDYDTFFNAKEDNAVYTFLGLPPPPGSKVGIFFLFYRMNQLQSFVFVPLGHFFFKVFRGFLFQSFKMSTTINIYNKSINLDNEVLQHVQLC